jgi:hypothetical protein
MILIDAATITMKSGATTVGLRILLLLQDFRGQSMKRCLQVALLKP